MGTICGTCENYEHLYLDNQYNRGDYSIIYSCGNKELYDINLLYKGIKSVDLSLKLFRPVHTNLL